VNADFVVGLRLRLIRPTEATHGSTILLTLKYAKVQLYPWPVFGLRGVNLVGSALRGDFPALTSVFLPRSFPNTAARQFRILTGFPIPTCSP
jgi:hypothetical protein